MSSKAWREKKATEIAQTWVRLVLKSSIVGRGAGFQIHSNTFYCLKEALQEAKESGVSQKAVRTIFLGLLASNLRAIINGLQEIYGPKTLRHLPERWIGDQES